jgi:hypothetical protein
MFIFQLNTCNYSPRITSSLTKEWAYRLQLLLALASAVILRSLFLSATQSQSQSYVTTDGQSASLSWNEAPIWGLRPDLYYYQTVAGLLMWGALSDERTDLSFARVTVSSNKSVVSMYNLHFTFVSPGSVQQIMPYH